MVRVIVAHIRPQPLRTETFEAFRLLDDGRMQPLVTESRTLSEAVEQAATLSLHKERFAIRRTDVETGAVTLHVYAVKQRSNATWNGKAMVRPLYADWLLDLRL